LDGSLSVLFLPLGMLTMFLVARPGALQAEYSHADASSDSGFVMSAFNSKGANPRSPLSYARGNQIPWTPANLRHAPSQLVAKTEMTPPSQLDQRTPDRRGRIRADQQVPE